VKQIAVDHSGKFYVANYGNNSVTTYTSAGKPSSPRITEDISDPSGVAVDASGNIFVANYSPPGEFYVTSYTAQGKLSSKFTIAGPATNIAVH
jgi:YD repeat-containing protein